MLGLSPLQLSATLAAVVAGRPPSSLLAAASTVPGAEGPAQVPGGSTSFLPEARAVAPKRGSSHVDPPAVGFEPVDGIKAVRKNDLVPFNGPSNVMGRQLQGSTWEVLTSMQGQWGSGLGWCTRLSADGTVWAVTSKRGNGEYDSVTVRSWNKSTNAWDIRETLTEEHRPDRFGEQIVLSSDGNRLAVGMPGDDNDRGKVRVYQWDEVQRRHVVLGSDLLGYTSEPNFGERLALSGDGNWLAVNGNGIWRTRVFHFQNNAWVLASQVFQGSVQPAFSEFGDVLALASSDQYYATVYERSGDITQWQWVQRGPTVGRNIGGLRGCDWASLSSDGNTMVCGSYAMSNFRGGAVVVTWNSDTNLWQQKGNTVMGTARNLWFGKPAEISADGNTFAATEMAWGPNRGAVFVFTYDSGSNTWNQVGDPIHAQVDGPSEYGAYHAMDLAANGVIVTAGRYRNNGLAEVYTLDGVHPDPPTPVPTQAPTSEGPWILGYDDTEANFTSGASNELEVGFFVGNGREVKVDLFKTCAKEAAPVPSNIYNMTVSHMPIPSNLTFSKVTVGYNFDEVAMVNSDLYNGTTDTLRFCQVTSLTTPDQVSGGSFVISQDKREIEVKFDLNADFEVDVGLGNRTIEEETEYISFDKDVEAYKCRGGNGNSFIADGAALPPNTQLAICIRVQNNTSIDIVQLANMAIDQDGLPEPRVFVENGNPKYGFTKMPVVSEGVIVKTLLPLGDNGFAFESGLSLNISGTVDLRLATDGRKLRALAGENNVAREEDKVAEINVVVGLQSTADGFGPIGSSDGHAIVGKGLAAIGMMVLAVTGVVMM